MERRNTIQKELVKNAVFAMRRHVTADEVYEYVKNNHPSVGKGTIYRNLAILSDQGEIRKIEIPNGPDHYDFTLINHYHVRCINCGEVSDAEIDEIPNLISGINSHMGMKYLDYDILFKGICEKCQKSSEAVK